jgi:anti-sigma factor RsiW
MNHGGEDLSAYLDGELTTLERLKVVSHLSGCQLCREELDDLILVRSRIRSLPVLEAPPQVINLPRRVVPIFRRRRLWVSAAAAITAVVVGFAALSTPQEPISITLEDLSRPYGALVSLDSGFNSGRVSPDLQAGGTG